MRQFKQCGAIAIAVAIFGICRAASDDYLVVDLSAGPGGPYPITYTNAAPPGGWTDAHKTSLLLLRKLPRGTFTMGSPTNEAGRIYPDDGREDQRSVTLSNDFYTGVFEMTEGQCSRLNTLFGFSAGSKRPAVDVASISFSELVDEAVSRLVNGTATNFALPNEAQWEYACRAGSALAYCFGSDTNLLSDYAWYNGVSQADVGLKSPNAYGLYDMHGNAAEAVENLTGSGRWLCGGSSSKDAGGCRSAVRDNYYYDSRIDGFRVCLTVPLKLYTVTVTNGTAEAASGTNGQVVAIWANPPADSDYIFERWLGDTQTVANVFATNTTITVPDRDVTVSATYRYAPRTLTVYDGSGSGQYAPGDEIVIVANDPADGFVFDHWRVDLGPENELGSKFAATNSTTTVTMPTSDVILSALYSPIPTYTLTVNGGAGSGSYTNGQAVTISADPPPPHHTFLWTGDTATVSDVTAWETSLAMPAANAAVTATYPPVLYELTVNGGWGGGSYTNGQVVTVTATNRPSSGHVFEVWTGDTNGLADAFAPTTTVTVAETAELTPLYRPSPMPDNTYLVVDLAASPGQAVTYRDDVPAGGWVGTYLTNRLVLRKIPAGTYLMGSPTGEAGRNANETQHTVTLTKVFYMGVFEVTQAQWYRLKGDWPSFSSGTDRPVRPVERVSYVDIRGATNSANWPATAAVDSDSFMGLLRTQTGDAAFDLPTEAQWEYACRAGTTGPYAGTGVLSEMGWYSANSGGGTKTVGQKAANAWGLYDMHGNVSELCLDWSADYSPTNQIDPPGAVGSLLNRRIMRGGAYHLTNDLCRSAYRGNLLPTNQWSFAGLRVARTAEAAYRLTVVDGLVNTGGLYFAGTQIPISPARKAGWRTFLRWEVSPAGVSLGSLFDAARADTVVTQPAQPVTLTARYQTRFLLLVK